MTDRTHDIATLITQLRILGQLTRAEAQVARLRVAQASSDAVRDELRQNATDADRRAGRIAGALRELGALPDPVPPLFSRVAALVRGGLEQTQPLDEAVLGDLVLEHQLRDRARYVGALADATGQPGVRELADHLVAAHAETIDWLNGVLADLGAGRPAALGASPLQQVAAQVTHAANAPARGALEGALDTVGAGVTKVAGVARDTAGKTLDAATSAASAAGEATTGVAQTAATTVGAVRKVAGETLDTVTGTTGKAVAGAVQGATAAADVVRDTAAHALHRTADAAQDATEKATEKATEEATEEVTEVTDAATAPGRAPTEPPVPGFADLPTHAAVAALRSLDDPDDVEAVRAFEQAHGDRPAVLEAARLRAAVLHTG